MKVVGLQFLVWGGGFLLGLFLGLGFESKDTSASPSNPERGDSASLKSAPALAPPSLEAYLREHHPPVISPGHGTIEGTAIDNPTPGDDLQCAAAVPAGRAGRTCGAKEQRAEAADTAAAATTAPVPDTKE